MFLNTNVATTDLGQQDLLKHKAETAKRIQQYGKTIDKLQDSIKRMQTELRELRNASTNNKFNELDKLNWQNANQNVLLKARIKKRNKLKPKLADLAEQLNNLRTAKRTKDFKRKVASLKANNEPLRKEKVELQRKLVSYAQALENSKKCIDAEKKREKRYKHEIEQLRRTIESMAKQVNEQDGGMAYTSQVAPLKERLAQLKQALGNKKIELMTVNQELEQANNRIDTIKQRIKAARKEFKAAQIKAQEQIRIKRSIKDNNQRTEQEFADTKAALERIIQENQRLQKSIDENAAKRAAVEAEIVEQDLPLDTAIESPPESSSESKHEEGTAEVISGGVSESNPKRKKERLINGKYGPEKIAETKELYESGLSYKEVAKRAKVGTSTINEWARKYKWVKSNRQCSERLSPTQLAQGKEAIRTNFSAYGGSLAEAEEQIGFKPNTLQNTAERMGWGTGKTSTTGKVRKKRKNASGQEDRIMPRLRKVLENEALCRVIEANKDMFLKDRCTLTEFLKRINSEIKISERSLKDYILYQERKGNWNLSNMKRSKFFYTTQAGAEFKASIQLELEGGATPYAVIKNHHLSPVLVREWQEELSGSSVTA